MKALDLLLWYEERQKAELEGDRLTLHMGRSMNMSHVQVSLKSMRLIVLFCPQGPGTQYGASACFSLADETLCPDFLANPNFKCGNSSLIS